MVPCVRVPVTGIQHLKVLLWHLAVLETCQDLMLLCLNISAAYPGPEKTGCFCWCENRGRAQRFWTLSSLTSNKSCTERKNLGNNSCLSLGNISCLAALLMWSYQKGKHLRKVLDSTSGEAKRHFFPSDPLLCGDYCIYLRKIHLLSHPAVGRLPVWAMCAIISFMTSKKPHY